MAITVYGDVIFPDHVIAADQPRGKSMRQNSEVQTDNGDISVNVVWSQSLREYEVATVPLLIEHWQEIEEYFEVTDGGARGMLLLDPKDHQVTNGALTRVSAGLFQLVKRYTVASRTRDRRITRPDVDTFEITESGGAVDFSLEVETGLVTIASDPDPATLAWSGRFYVPVRFLNQSLDWQIEKTGEYANRMASGQTVILQEIRE